MEIYMLRLLLIHYNEYKMRINGVDYKTENKSYKRVSTVMDKVKTFYERKNKRKIEDKLIKEFIVI
jgi:hypothetical protein